MHYSRITDWHNYHLTGVRDTNQSSKPGIVITYFLIAAIQLHSSTMPKQPLGQVLIDRMETSISRLSALFGDP